jgi:hypothetical protein
MKWVNYKMLLLTGLAAAAVGCSSIDCPVENTVAVHYLVCNSDGTELALTDSLSVESKNFHGNPILLNRLSGSATFSLPISYSHPEDVMTFTFFNDSVSRSDTVWLKKNDIPHFESVDCSAAFFHELTDVRHTTHAIDSLVIKNRTVDYDTRTVHLHLYPKSSD